MIEAWYQRCCEESVGVKCFGCDALLEADDSDAVADAFVDHGRVVHAWSYPEQALRNYPHKTTRRPRNG